MIVLGGTSEAEDAAAEVTSGRTTLIEGGWELAKERPLGGHGSASFSKSFAEQEDISRNQTTVSHNEPVTVAAEQGASGILVYLAPLAAALWTLLVGHAPDRARASGRPPTRSATRPREARARSLWRGWRCWRPSRPCSCTRSATAGYLTDPLTWALLAIGGSLAAGPTR